MVTLIIGDNAIGKSVYLKNKADITLKSGKSVVYNGWDNTYLKKKKYNENRIDALCDILDIENIIENDQYLAMESSFIKVTDNLAKILTLICKDADYLYLDEPEYGLSNREVGILVAFLCKIMNTFINIEIVTHSELFFGISDADIKTIKLNNKKQYVTSELGDNKYVTID